MRKIFITSIILFTIALLRFADVAVKKVIKNEVEELTLTNEKFFPVKESLSERAIQLEQEISLQELKTALANETDCYLVLERRTKQAWLKIEDKIIREMDFEIWLLPELGERSFLPSGILQVLAKQESTNFYIPDFYYELLGDSIPVQPGVRIIKNAFGPYALYLGKDLLIHGPFHPDLPKDLVKHNGIIFKPADLEVIYHSLKPKARVVFY